ncbi:MAG: transposase, partial [Methanobrevibacter sp.]|nr:transposase [Methanobrevibacter sp.]
MLKQHIENLKGHVDFKNTILILDRGYYFLELKLFLKKHCIKYISRLQKDTYGSEISQMKSDDENIKIKNTTNRRQNISDENTLKKLKKMTHISAKVIKIPIINKKG